MWIRCNINGDMINLHHIEEIEIVPKHTNYSVKHGLPPHYEIEVVFAHPTDEKPKKRKTIFIGSREDCESYSEYIGKQLNVITHYSKKQEEVNHPWYKYS